jgi:hypothetical protein
MAVIADRFLMVPPVCQIVRTWHLQVDCKIGPSSPGLGLGGIYLQQACHHAGGAVT